MRRSIFLIGQASVECRDQTSGIITVKCISRQKDIRFAPFLERHFNAFGDELVFYVNYRNKKWTCNEIHLKDVHDEDFSLDHPKLHAFKKIMMEAFRLASTSQASSPKE